MQKMDTNKIELEYRRKQAKAELASQRRILEQTQKALKTELANIRTIISTEHLVHKQLEEYLKGKTDEIKNKITELGNKTEK